MAKHSFEFKLKLVRAYLQGEGSFRSLRKKYGVDYSTIKRWCANYKEYGEEPLKRSRKYQKHTFEFKLHVVELCLTTGHHIRSLRFNWE